MDNRVTVKILGQEYIIAGDKPGEKIKEIAEYVDNKMRLISKVTEGSSVGSIAILSSINIAEEYFDCLEQMENLRTSKVQLENDSKYYLKMWEDSKKNYIKYKDSLAELNNQKKDTEDKIKELEAKCSEFENSFFDLQMENIQLKSQLEKLKTDNKRNFIDE